MRTREYQKGFMDAVKLAADTEESYPAMTQYFQERSKYLPLYLITTGAGLGATLPAVFTSPSSPRGGLLTLLGAGVGAGLGAAAGKYAKKHHAEKAKGYATVFDDSFRTDVQVCSRTFLFFKVLGPEGERIIRRYHDLFCDCRPDTFSRGEPLSGLFHTLYLVLR